ncbi:MAG: glycosyltransferase [Acidobacteriota bacterium]
MTELSIVIPTRDRHARLRQTLEATVAQRREVDFEIIVVDDGSASSAEGATRGLATPVRFLRLPPGGPARARNRGAALARAARVLFLGDDTRPAPGALAEHVQLAGRLGDVGVQGHIDWDPERPITELMRFLAPEGPQFYFKGLEPRQMIPFSAVLGSNLSVPAAWLRAEPFDEGFPFAAVEDTEAAWRWHRRGWRTVYAPGALCWHRHHYAELGPFLERQRRAGSSARHAARLHPRLVPKLVLEPLLYGLVIRMRSLVGRSRRHDAWDLACRRAYFSGFLTRANAIKGRSA